METDHHGKGKIMKLSNGKKSVIQTMLTLLLTGVGASNGVAATIFWNGAQNITDDSDVSTFGSLVDAFNLGASGVPDATVNGVTFTAFVFPTAFDFNSTVSSGNYNFTETGPGELTSYNNLGTVSGAYFGLSPGYQILAGSGGGSTFLDSLQLTISGLTIGQLYQFQWWNNDSSLATSPSGLTLNTIGTADNSVSLLDNTSATSGDVGQYAIGTFIADDVTQTINFDGNGADPSDPLVNAFQLREAPEPSTWLLTAIGFTVLALKFAWAHKRTI
jgi:hypothetical protein